MFRYNVKLMIIDDNNNGKMRMVESMQEANCVDHAISLAKFVADILPHERFGGSETQRKE